MHGAIPSTSVVFEHPDYQLDRLLGAGGQAEVFLAHHRTLARKVAIKVMRENQGESMARRMLQEGRLIANLRHPNLVQVFDAGHTKDGRPYIVMEYIEGAPLSRLPWRKELTIPQALELVWQVASGLSVAHEAGIVHRDVKPLNILVEERRGATGPGFCAKLVDFGVARPPESEETAVGVVIGTVGFMAPEVVEGEPIPASDVFSLGVILHGLLAGTHGVRASQIRKRLQEEPDPEEAWRQHPELTQLVEEMIAPSAARRPRDAAALVARLEALRPWDRFAGTATTWIGAPPMEAGSAETAVEPATSLVSPSMLAALVGALGVAAIGLACVFMALQQQAAPSSSSAALAPIPPVVPASTETQEAGPAPAAAVPETTPEAPPEVAVPEASEPTGSASPAPAAPEAPPSSPPSTAAPADPAPAPSGSAEPPSEAPADAPAATAPPSAPAADGPPASSPAATPPPESTPPAPVLPVGRYPGTIQGRPLEVELAGTASALRAVLRLQVGERTETHTLSGSAVLRGEVWSLALSEPGGKWAMSGTLGADRLQAAVTIKGKERGRVDARRTP